MGFAPCRAVSMTSTPYFYQLYRRSRYSAAEIDTGTPGSAHYNHLEVFAVATLMPCPVPRQFQAQAGLHVPDFVSVWATSSCRSSGACGLVGPLCYKRGAPLELWLRERGRGKEPKRQGSRPASFPIFHRDGRERGNEIADLADS
jgi:hypothetical protein